ncbi:MAG: DUF2156 domain-containing protein [Candidatus Limimorpha sp.]
MIPFKDLCLEDRDTILKYTLPSQNASCDLSFSSLMAWKFMYDTQFAIIEDFLVFRYHDGIKTAYMIPIGTGNDIEPVINLLIEDAKLHGFPFLMLASHNYLNKKLTEKQMERFSFSCNRNLSEYVYNREDLALLKGSKYQAKRNHVNKFRNTYSKWEYKVLTPELVGDCLSMEKEWYQANIDKDSESIELERRALTFTLHHIQDTGALGGVLCVDCQIAAFTLGCPINYETFDVQFEKADTKFEGAYTVINQLFVQHLPEKYIFINREEDLGLEGLRHAKSSYHPVKMLDRCMMTLK